jgi:SAM-dependent methyltransferase
VAVGGSVLGVDVSAAAVARAREAARDEGVRNVAFECGDAQVHPFPAGEFDLAISRFGTMFFADPVAAFGNVARALRPDGRLVMLVWQAREQNEWAVEIERVLGATTSESADAFSLGDPTTTTAILDAAGFAEVTLAGVRRPVHYGPDVGHRRGLGPRLRQYEQHPASDWIRGRRACTRPAAGADGASTAPVTGFGSTPRPGSSGRPVGQVLRVLDAGATS